MPGFTARSSGGGLADLGETGQYTYCRRLKTPQRHGWINYACKIWRRFCLGTLSSTFLSFLAPLPPLAVCSYQKGVGLDPLAIQWWSLTLPLRAQVMIPHAHEAKKKKGGGEKKKKKKCDQDWIAEIQHINFKKYFLKLEEGVCIVTSYLWGLRPQFHPHKMRWLNWSKDRLPLFHHTGACPLKGFSYQTNK